jgi:hypothetical protein
MGIEVAIGNSSLVEDGVSEAVVVSGESCPRKLTGDDDKEFMSRLLNAKLNGEGAVLEVGSSVSSEKGDWLLRLNGS